MAEKYRGIELEIGGDLVGLKSALKDLDKELSKTQNELKAVDRALKLDPTNTELAAQKQKLLAEQTERTKQRVEALESAKAQADEAMAKGTEVNQEQYRALVREIVKTKSNLRALETQTEQLGNTVEEVGDSAKDAAADMGKLDGGAKSAGGGFTIAKGAVAAFAGNLLTGLAGACKNGIKWLASLADETREYREDMNKLKAAFNATGKSTESAKAVYKDFYKILGESDRSVEAVNHLAELCNGEEELSKWGKIAAGVTAKFGDSLPIEGLTEAANETAKVAKVTGPLADALNWAGISEDEFNDKLAALTTEQERSALITETLSGKYTDVGNAYLELNGSAIRAREATAQWDEATAKLGATFEPLTATVKGWAASAMSAFADVTAKVVEYVQQNAALTSSEWEFIETYKERQKATEESTEAFRAQTEQREADMYAALGQIEYARKLYDELVNLADENGVVSEAERARAEFIITQLNEALGTNLQLNGQQITGLQQLRQSIDDVVLAEKARIVFESQKEQFAQNIDMLTEAQENEKQAAIDLAAAEGQLAKLYERGKDLVAGNNQEYINHIGQVNSAKSAIEKLTKQHEEYGKTVIELTSETQKYEQAYAEFLQGNTQQAIDLLTSKSDAVISEAEIEKKTLEEQQQIRGQKYAEAVLQLYDYVKKYGNSTDEAHKAQIAKLEQQAVDAGEKAKAVGVNVGDGMIVGLKGKILDIEHAIESLANNSILGKFHKLLQINSPSKKMIPIGEAVDEGLAKGVKKSKTVEEAIKEKADIIQKSYKAELSKISAAEDIYKAQYEMGRITNENATIDERAAQKTELLNFQYAQQEKRIKAVNDALYSMRTETGYYSEQSRELEVQLNKEQLALMQLGEEYKNINTVKEKADAINEQYKKSVGVYDTNSDIANAQLELWKLRNPKASEYDIASKGLDTLKSKFRQQEATVKETNDALYSMRMETGYYSEESRALELQLINEQIALEKLKNEYKELAAAKRQAAQEKAKAKDTAALDNWAYIAKYGDVLRKQGVSDDEIRTAAARATGYTEKGGSVSVVQNFYTPTVTPSQQYNATKKAVNDMSVQAAL